jgi:hypothetical protein
MLESQFQFAPRGSIEKKRSKVEQMWADAKAKRAEMSSSDSTSSDATPQPTQGENSSTDSGNASSPETATTNGDVKSDSATAEAATSGVNNDSTETVETRESKEQKITSTLNEFRVKARSYRNSRQLVKDLSSTMAMEEKKYLMDMLDNTLGSAGENSFIVVMIHSNAEERLKDMQYSLDDQKSRQDLLEELNRKLQLAEDKILGKDKLIQDLQVEWSCDE